MATKTRDLDNSAEERNNILEINISLSTHFSALSFVNGALTFVSIADYWVFKYLHDCTKLLLICYNHTHSV